MLSRLLPCLLIALCACGDSAHSIASNPKAPAAEFILAAGDSAYWVTSDTSGIHVRGAPIELACLDGRFMEVYVVDDDYSYDGADLVGQSVYRRDLRSGDSVRVFTDSIVPALARRYAADHPGEQRLAPEEEGNPDPEIKATATLEFAGSHGPFVSYSLHTDVERSGAALWHTTRTGVLDLRSGKVARLGDIVGREAAAIERRRDEMLRSVLDSVRVRAAGLLPRYRFDPTSFTITSVDGMPAIAYSVPIAGSGDIDQTLPLPAVPFAGPAWWRDIAASMPAPSPDSAQDRWQHGALSVLARYDSTGAGRVVLRDASSREFPVGSISSPATRIYWLERNTFDPETRHALIRAFNEAASYGAETHVAVRPAPSLFQLTSHTR